MNFRYFTLFLAVAILNFFLVDASEYSDLFLQVLELIKKEKTYVLPTNNDAYFKPENASNRPIDFGAYDFVIVGGGTAGGVLANRITEEKYSALIIEAGKEDPITAGIIGLAPLFYHSDYNWGYNTVPQKHGCLGVINQSCLYIRGKGLGGTSILNGGIYIRGSAEEYDKWEALGNPGWSFKDCLPYFRKSENAEFSINRDDKYHGFEGPQNIGVVDDTPGMTSVFLEAFKELGINQKDYNGEDYYSFSRIQAYIDFNNRSSTAQAFIRPAKSRTNLYITLESLATKIRIRDGKARGVEFVKGGKKYLAKATREVIISAGAINSPQLLMLSGIGPARELKKHGIKVLANLPVGEYLSDHIFAYTINYRTNRYNFGTSLEENFELWKKGKRPLNGAQAIQVASFWNVAEAHYSYRQDVGIYAFQALGAPAMKYYQFKDEYIKAYEAINTSTDIAIPVFLLHPNSYGRVTLQSKDPRDYPLIDPDYFSDPSDLEAMYKGVQIALKLNNTKSFRNAQIRYILNSFPDCDGKYEKMSKKWWICGFQYTVSSMFHASGTTRMGPSPTNSVVNSELKVHGIKRLRVVDTGVIPASFNGHPNAAVVMIAEKIADSIKAEHRS